ncbi:hypothetical protein VSAK1_26310 [Vibrio mediterranei AK1]|nr:hypothetical protein VSAK1_26310 [Vibrio mediterranei AK1]
MINFPSFGLDASPSESKPLPNAKRQRLNSFKGMTRSEFDEWCVANKVSTTSLKWEDYFIEWRKANSG